jgi:polysaccharide biosynthesis transport protein
VQAPSAQRSASSCLAHVLRRKWCLLLVVVLCVAAVAVRSFMTPIHYLAVATVQLSEEDDNKFYAPSILSDPNLKYFRAHVFYRTKTIAQVMNSVPVRQAVTAHVQLSLASRPSDSASTGSPRTAVGSAVPTQLIVPSVTVTEAKGTSLLNLTTVSGNREMAQSSLEGYLSVLSQYYMQRRHGDALKAAAWLKEELERTEQGLLESRAAVREFRMRHGVLSGNDHQGLIHQIATNWLDDVGASLEVDNRAPVHQEGNTLDLSNSPREEGDSSHLTTLKQKLLSLQKEYAKFEYIYSPTYPKLVTLKRQIRLFEQMVSDLEAQSLPAFSAESERTKLWDELARARHSAVQLASLGPQFHLLAMEAENNQRFYELILAEYKKAEQRAESISVDVFVTHPPTTVEARPSHLKSLGQAAVVGLLGGLLLAVILGEFDTRLHSAAEIEDCIPCPVLGTTPDLSRFRRNPSPTGAGGSTPLEFLAYEDPRSPIYEAMRNIHSSIFLSNLGEHIQCIAVSSSLPGEGKTLTGVSLAGILSLDPHKKVLLVDADLRRPRIHKVFGREQGGVGLTTLVEGGSRDWRSIIQPTRLPRLFCLTSGPIPHDPVAVLHSEAMHDLLAALRESFDCIVLDTPPVLGFPDAIILSRQADGLILVAEEAVVRREEIREAYRAVSSTLGTRVLGVIVNKSQLSKRWNNYYRGYAYGYRYGKYGTA